MSRKVQGCTVDSSVDGTLIHYRNGANLTGETVRAEYGTRLDPSSEELDWSYFSDTEFSYEVEDATKIRIHQLAGYEVSAYAYRYTVTTATGEVVKTFE